PLLTRQLTTPSTPSPYTTRFRSHTVLEHDHRRCLILEERLQLLGDLSLCPIIRAFLLPLGACLGLLMGHRERSPRSWRRSSSMRDRKSTRLNSSHGSISYAVFCL